MLIQGTKALALGYDAFNPKSPGYVLKLEWAVTHLNAITVQAAKFIESDFNTPVGEEYEFLDDGWVILKWGKIRATPPTWPLLLSDYLHNLRSCLDHVVYALAVEARHPDPDGTQFPIYDAARKWTQDIEERDPARKPSPIAGLPDAVVDDIKALQPFRHKRDKARKRDPLMRLLIMSNADKHRRLYASMLSTGKIQHLRFEPPGYIRILRKRVPPAGHAPKRSGEIARVQIERLREQDTEVGARYKTPVQIAFGEWGEQTPAFTAAVLFEILNAVIEVGNRLAPHLKDGFSHSITQPGALPPLKRNPFS